MNTDIHHYLELLWAMTDKELRARYKYTVFGFFWLIINPLLQMLIIGFVFRFFMKENIRYYNYYLFIGLLVWNFFSLSLSKATPSIVFERNLIKKAKFSRSVIPLAIIFANLVHLIIAMLLYTVPVLFLRTLTLEKLPLLIMALMLLVLFTVGLSLLTSSLNVRFRDVTFFVQAILIIWFYATPVVYTLSIIPHEYLWLWRLNPMTSVVQLLQFVFVNSEAPGLLMLAANTAVTVAVAYVGVKTFNREDKNFDDWL